MDVKIENEIINGAAVALYVHQQDLIEAAFAKGLKVYCPTYGWTRKFEWFDKAAGMINRLRIAELCEAVAK